MCWRVPESEKGAEGSDKWQSLWERGQRVREMLEGERGDGEWVRKVEEVPKSGKDVRE